MSTHQNHNTKQKQAYLLILFFSVILILCGIFFTDTVTQAKINLGETKLRTLADGSGYELADQTTLAANTGRIINVVLSMVGTIFLAITVYAGIIWMTARGDESKAEASQKMLRNAIIGLVITLGAYSITAFVLPEILSRSGDPSGPICKVGSPAECLGKAVNTTCNTDKKCKKANTNQTAQGGVVCQCK